MRRAYRRQPPRSTKVDGHSPLGRAITAHFTFNNTFTSAARGKGRSPVVTGTPAFKNGPSGWYAQGAPGSGSSAGYVTFPDLLPSVLGMAGASPRSFVCDFYLADINFQRGVFSYGDSSRGQRTQFSLLINNSYQSISLNLYGEDPSYNCLDRGNTGARVFLAVAYDGNVTITFKSWAKYDVDGTVYAKTETRTLSSPLTTGNTVPLALMGGGTYPDAWATMDQPLYHLSMYGGRCLTLAEMDSLYADRYQVMQPPQEFPYTALTATGADGNATVTGVQASSAVGTVTASAGAGATATLTGVQSTGQVGTLTATASAVATLTGVQSTSSVGTISASGAAQASIASVQATSQAGTIAASGAAAGSATITGVQASSQAGNVTALGAASINIVGSQAASQVGTIQATAGGSAIVTVAGISSTASTGSIVATGAGRAHVGVVDNQEVDQPPFTGVEATSEVGTVIASGAASAPVQSVAAFGQIGNVAAGGGTSAYLLGVAAAGRVGAIAAVGEASPDATAYLQGVGAAATAGTVSAYGARAGIAVNVTEDMICTEVRDYILSIAPAGMRVLRTPVNKASMPKGAYVSFTPGLRRDVSTNRDNYSDNGRFVGRSEMMAFQVNCYGKGSSDLAETLNVLFRDQYAIEQFTGDIVPLYASAIQQAPFVNDADQYEDCYIFEIELQINSQIVVPQASCNILEIEVISVDATFPP